MISICIPVYNYDIRKLVQQLHEQAVLLQVPFEIILADDASDEAFQRINRLIEENDYIRQIFLDKNTGRSAIRNLLAQMARYTNIIFMDCDSLCPDRLFLKKYLDVINQAKVVCGGRIYFPEKPNDATRLHWTYGKAREAKPASVRSLNPWNSFMTNNFMISKDVFEKITFNEKLRQYGHEDTLFGWHLKKQGIDVLHIDNPLLHAGLQNTKDFLDKTRKAIENLIEIFYSSDKSSGLINMVKLLRTWQKIKSWNLCPLVRLIFFLTKPLIILNLGGRWPIVSLLDFYKLSTLCSLDSEKNV